METVNTALTCKHTIASFSICIYPVIFRGFDLIDNLRFRNFMNGVVSISPQNIPISLLSPKKGYFVMRKFRPCVQVKISNIVMIFSAKISNMVDCNIVIYMQEKILFSTFTIHFQNINLTYFKFIH